MIIITTIIMVMIRIIMIIIIIIIIIVVLPHHLHAHTPKASADAATVACTSASALLSATVFCWRLYVLMACVPIAMMIPLVLLAVAMHPAQSDSM